MAMFDVISAAASISPKEEGQNDDRVLAYRGRGAGAGVVLCDGLGSLAGSGETAEEVCFLATDHMVRKAVWPGVWELDGVLARTTLRSRRGATTLIVLGASEEGLVGHLLVGNGSLIEAVPAAPSGAVPHLLWTDISVPQITWEGGRPALSSVLPAQNGDLEAAKGCRNAPRGLSRLYLACSDGISSDEERAQGAAPDGSLWKEVPIALARILDRLSTRWESLTSSPREAATLELNALLEDSLAELAAEPASLDDDASVGAVLLRARNNGDEAEAAR